MLIYAAEDPGARGQMTRRRLHNATGEFAISPLVRLESLVRPTRDRNDEQVEKLTEMMAQFETLAIDDYTFELATHLRARHLLDTADALHVATAHQYGCDEIWTNDSDLATAAPAIAVNIFKDE